MTLQKKEVAAPAKDSVDEIDEIMNEIEELQQSMSNSQAAPAPKASSRSKAPAAAAPVEEEPNVMEEFQAGSGEVSMEETLADLKDEEPSGPNLIDQAMEAEAARDAAGKTDEKHDELLEEYESDALDEAVAREEQEALEELEEVEQEEEVTMSEAPRRGRSLGSSVSLKLAGEMTLKLSYEFEGQEVTIGFVDGALKVELSDGTEFKIPVRRNPLRKVA